MMAIEDAEAVTGKVRAMLELVRLEAERSLHTRGGAGWLRLERRATEALASLDAEVACQNRFHSYWLDLEVVSIVLEVFVLPDRWDELREGVERTLRRESDWDDRSLRRGLAVIDPALGGSSLGELDGVGVLEDELAFLRGLSEFRARPGISSLSAALDCALRINRKLASVTGHEPCEHGTMRASAVVARTLIEVVPLFHRRGLGRVMADELWRRHAAPDEYRGDFSEPPGRLCPTVSSGHVFVPVSKWLLAPHEDGDPRWDGRPWLLAKCEAEIEAYVAELEEEAPRGGPQRAAP